MRYKLLAKNDNKHRDFRVRQREDGAILLTYANEGHEEEPQLFVIHADDAATLVAAIAHLQELKTGC